MKKQTTRDQIIEEADELFYQHGFEHTSFADIAGVVNISRGNFYHHFKTKDEILNAVIELRMAKTRQLLDKWELEGSTPKERIICFISILIMNMAKIKLYGCPVGSLCMELAKIDHPLQRDASKLFTLFREWLKKQFDLLGFEKRSDELAINILGRTQGVAVLASSFQDEKLIRLEVKQMTDWLQNLQQ